MDLDSAIRARATRKVLANADHPTPGSLSREQVLELLATAGWAPFHRPCDERHRSQTALTGIEPWRFHTLLAEQCRQTKEFLLASTQREQAGKIPQMLAAADALVLATWLPNPPATTATEALFDPSLANMEHIAAAAAAIQNLCLAATARGIANYWSSGGVLRSPETFQFLGIPSEEIVLGAIFLFPEDTRSAEVVGSKLRERRTSVEHWARLLSDDS